MAVRHLKEVVQRVFCAGVEASLPEVAMKAAFQCKDGELKVVEESFDCSLYSEVLVLGLGKAASQMVSSALEVMEEWEVPKRGVMVTKDGHGGVGKEGILDIEAGHPIPTANSIVGGKALLEAAESAMDSTLALVLLSGGGSSLSVAPIEGWELDEVRELNHVLLASGASIDEINTLRPLWDRIKGGGLGRALHGAGAVVTLALSDVVGNDLSIIASGPTTPPPPSSHSPSHILTSYPTILTSLSPPTARKLQSLLEESSKECRGSGEGEESDESSGGGGEVVGRAQRVVREVIGSNVLAVAAAKREAELEGFEVLVLGTEWEGEAKVVGSHIGQMAKSIARGGWKEGGERKICLIAGGESTVQLEGDHGKGGRNMEVALAAAKAISNIPGVVILAGGTDGTDGPTDAAGGIIDGETWSQPGPTGTNVMDLTIALIQTQKDGDTRS